jgi:hypothetical protein
MNRLILSVASLVVPDEQRAEWLAEWSGELWQAEAMGRGATAFCLGAFRDAFWLRRNARLPRAYGPLLIDCPRTPAPPPAPESRLLDSPVRCIAFLGFLAAMNWVIYQLFTAHLPEPSLFRDQWGLLICTCLVAPSVTSIYLGDYPGEHHRFRRRLFLTAKMALIFAAVIFGARDVALASQNFFSGAWMTFWGTLLGVRWAFLDQQRRCPVCLRLLSNPVRIGLSSHNFLEWNGIELACLRGHGLLHVPGGLSIWFTRQRWMRFDASWRSLF